MVALQRRQMLTGTPVKPPKPRRSSEVHSATVGTLPIGSSGRNRERGTLNGNHRLSERLRHGSRRAQAGDRHADGKLQGTVRRIIMTRGVTAHEDEAPTSHETYQDPGEALRGSTPPQHTNAPQGNEEGPDHSGQEETRRTPGRPAASAALAAVSVLLIASVTRRCVTVFGSRSSGGLISRVSVSTGPCTWRVATTASPASTVPFAFVSLTKVACTVLHPGGIAL